MTGALQGPVPLFDDHAGSIRAQWVTARRRMTHDALENRGVVNVGSVPGCGGPGFRYS